MAKVRLHDPVTGKFHWVERSALQADGPAHPSAAPSAPPEAEGAGPKQDSPAPAHHREHVPAGPSARARNPRDPWDTFFDGNGTETVDREDL